MLQRVYMSYKTIVAIRLALVYFIFGVNFLISPVLGQYKTDRRVSRFDTQHILTSLQLPLMSGSKICPSMDPMLLPFPGNCTKFYKCDLGKAVEKECPNGLYFNKDESICDFPQDSGCSQSNSTVSTHSSEPNTITAEPETTTTSKRPPPLQTTTTPHHKTSKAWWSTSEHDTTSSVYESSPPTIQHTYTTEITETSYKTTTSLKPSTTSVTTTLKPTSAPVWHCPTKSPSEPWRYTYPYPGDCTRFYRCSNGFAYVMHCPQGTYFNTYRMVCDWQQDSHCQI